MAPHVSPSGSANRALTESSGLEPGRHVASISSPEWGWDICMRSARLLERLLPCGCLMQDIAHRNRKVCRPIPGCRMELWDLWEAPLTCLLMRGSPKTTPWWECRQHACAPLHPSSGKELNKIILYFYGQYIILGPSTQLRKRNSGERMHMVEFISEGQGS